MRTIVYVDGFNLYYKRIRTSDLAASQLPVILTDATGTIHKPANWWRGIPAPPAMPTAENA